MTGSPLNTRKKNQTNLTWFCTIFNQSLFCWKRTLVFCLRYSFDCISFKTALWRYYTVLANNSFQMSILWSISRKNFNLELHDMKNVDDSTKKEELENFYFNLPVIEGQKVIINPHVLKLLFWKADDLIHLWNVSKNAQT